MREKNRISLVIVIGFICIFSLDAVCGIEDDKVQSSGNTTKPELNTANSVAPKVVTVSNDDTVLTGTQKTNESTTLTPIETATSVAVGMIASGTTDKSVVKATLVSYGYEQTEAEIAYAKAITSNILAETPKTSNNDIDTKALNTTPAMPAKDRVAQTVTTRPAIKFRQRLNQQGNNKVTQNEKDTVNQMISEGYSLEQIAEGFVANRFNSNQTAAIFKEAGVSSMDAYDALSSMAVKKAETNVEKEMIKPRTKFAKRFGKNTTEQQKQDAIKTTINEMQAAGYDIQGTLDSAVQDLKDNGMSAQEVKDFLIAKVADGKPKAKFGNTLYNRIMSNRVHNMQSYSQGEISLATAMIKAGYTKSEVESTLQSGNYKYTSGDTQMIVSAAEKNISEQASSTLTPASSEIPNANESDILRRNTQAIPI